MQLALKRKVKLRLIFLTNQYRYIFFVFYCTQDDIENPQAVFRPNGIHKPVPVPYTRYIYPKSVNDSWSLVYHFEIEQNVLN